MARIAQALYRRLDAGGWRRAVRMMREGDVIDVPALPPGEASGPESGGEG